MHRTYLNLFIVFFVLSSSLLFSSIPAQASKGVGKAIISIGKVSTTSKDGVEKKLKRRGKVFEGDTITVGKKSRLQLRFIDNQLVVLKADTVFRIDEYKFKDKNDNNKSAALSLLKGGMRSVTGLIGKSARDKYKVRTPVATMGVRGTHYVIQICNSDCGDGVKGIVGTVLQGSIVMTNDAGTQEFGTDQFFNVPSKNEAPKAMTNPPAVLISRSETKADEEDKEEDNKQVKGKNKKAKGKAALAKNLKLSKLAASGRTPNKKTLAQARQRAAQRRQGTRRGTLPPPAINPNLDPNFTPIGFIAGIDAPDNAVLLFSGLNSVTQFPIAGGGVQGFNGSTIRVATVNGVDNQPVAANIIGPVDTTSYAVLSNGVAIEQGGDALGVNWGRWITNDIVVRQNGNDANLITGLAFVYSDNLTPLATVAGLTTGTVTYNSVGGPSIRDEAGVLVTGSLAIDFDFTGAASTITGFNGTLSGNGRVYSVSLDPSGPFPLSILATGGNVPIVAGCSGCPDQISFLIGQTGGAFVGASAEGFISSFGLGGIGATGQVIGVSGSGFLKAGTPPN